MQTFAFLGFGPVDSTPFLLFLHLLQVAVFVALIRHLDVYEREPLLFVLALFVWGGLIAVPLSMYGNGFVDSLLSPITSELYGAAISAPLVEETAKGLALVLLFALVFTWSRRRRTTSEFGGVTDGIVYGAAVGFGFAFVENILYYVQQTSRAGAEVGLDVLLLRADFAGLQSFGHALYTAFLGAGLGYALWTRSRARQIAAVTGGLAVAMGLHASWNGLTAVLMVREYGRDVVLGAFTQGVLPASVPEQEFLAAMDRYGEYSTVVFYFGLLGLVVLFWLWLRYERKIIAYELAEEANAGLITAEEYRLLPSVRARYRFYAGRLRRGASVADVRQLHDRLTDLATMKWRTRLFGGDGDRIDRARAEIGLLRSYHEALGRLDLAEPQPVGDTVNASQNGNGVPVETGSARPLAHPRRSFQLQRHPPGDNLQTHQ